MTISKNLKSYLDDAGVRYDTVVHPRTATTAAAAEVAHIPGDNVAKSVVIHHEEGYVLAVVPASHRVDLSTLQFHLDRRLGLASEEEIDTLFADCDRGAAPPIGEAYGVKTMLDPSLTGRNDIWFEGGDHKTLVHVSGADFDRMMEGARKERISYHV